MTTTDYSGGFIYENNALQHFAHEEGRVRKSGANLVYDYYIKDHLGNTRMTLTEATDITEYRATMETGTSSSGTNMETYEENLFLNVEEVRSTQPGINTTDVPGFTDDKVAALNGSVAARRAGPAKLLAVTAGDQVSVTVDSYHTGNTSTGVQTKATMVSAIAGLFGGLSGGGVEQQAVYDLFNGVSTTGFLYSGSMSTSAKAYLNMLVFDQDFNFVGVGGFDRADQTSDYQTLSVSATINQGGYVYVYLSNESTANFEVYFDNLNITHTKGAILQEDHYYLFGLNISALSSTAPLTKPNKFKYNGMELNEEFDLDWYTPEFRSYDPQLGRFHQVDPVVKHHESLYAWNTNNPISFNDPLGSDSTQRANAVAQMQQHIDEGTTYTWNISAYTAPSGNAPGVAGNCSSTVSNCVVTAGEPNPSNVTPTGDTGSGVLNIEGNTTSVNNSEVEAGNIVTFRMDGNYPYHTGLVTGVSTNDEGNTVITFGHNSSGNGAQSDSFVLGSGESWDSNSPAFFKWDTTPDAQSNTSGGAPTATSQASSTSASRTSSSGRSVSSRISSTARNVRGQVASFLAEGRRRILGGG